jgi:uncharacterized membrane protein YozB (DUF420 family)
MSTAPLASTIIAVGLIPVAFLFIHAFLSGRRKSRFHAVSGALAISWDLIMSIGYMLYRSFGGAVEGSTIEMTSTFIAYFAVHGAVAVIVMALEIAVLAIGIKQIRSKTPNKLHGKLAKVLFGVWWFAFLTGEIYYIVMYLL